MKFYTYMHCIMNKNSYILENLQKKLYKHLIFVKEGCIISGNSNNISKRSMTKMKKTVKILSVVLALILVIGCFAACGKKEEKKTEEKKTLVMATNAEFPPYEYHEGDAVVGIDAEIAKLIADKLGMELKIEDVAFDSIIPGVQAGKYDMGMAGMTVNEERLQSVNFSDSYATGVQVVIVKEGGSIASLDDIAGKKIGVQTSTTGDIYASDDFGDENVVKFDSGAAAVEALKSGKVDCVIIDNEPAKSYVAANEGLKILETEYAVEDYAICFAKENTELKEKVNAALKELIADGSVQKIIDKYINA